MYFMRLAAWLARGYAGFFWANTALLALLALATAWMLFRMAGERALYFAIAPTLLVYAFVNWDLLAVALATAGTLFYLRDRDEASGAFLGLGAAAKLYPAFLVLPFVLGRIRDRRIAGAVALVVWSAITFVVVNAPFALAGREGWLTFFRYNAKRPTDFDSVWYLACNRLHAGCSLSSRTITVASLLVIAVLATGVWWARRVRQRAFPRWTFGFPLLVLFLLVNKVYSPQYGLWLLPWFPLALPNLPLFIAFEGADLAVFVTRFSWFGRYTGIGGVPLGAFQLALLVRAAVLVACVAAWALRRDEEVLLVPGGIPALADLQAHGPAG
jgi:uncharacterized membrane protein